MFFLFCASFSFSSKGILHIAQALVVLMLIGVVYMVISELFHGMILFNLVACAAASAFCEWVQVGIDEYVSHQKYPAYSLLSSRFLAAFVAAHASRNHSFPFYQHGNSALFKTEFRLASDFPARFLHLQNLLILMKQENV